MKITGGEVIVDDDLAPLLATANWHIAGTGKYRYARKRAPKGVYLGRRTTWIYMHHAILGIVPDAASPTDHVNGNTLDNRRENLRVTTHIGNTHDHARRTYGAEHPLAILSDNDVKRILGMRSRGMTYQSIADEFGTGRTIIRNICTGKRGKGTQVKAAHASSASAARRR